MSQYATLFIFVAVIVGMWLFTKAAGNPLNHSKAYRRRRLFNWLPLGLTYSFLYMGRYNLTVSKTALGDLMPKDDFGIIFGVGAITYAFSFLINGPLVDKIGGRKGIIIGAVGSSVMNAALGGLTFYILNNPSTTLNIPLAFSVIYALNMYFQSYGAVSIVKVNANWFHVKERGSFSGIFGILISLGIYFAFDWGHAIVQATGMTLPEHMGPFQTILRWIVVSPEMVINPTWLLFFIPAGVLVLFVILDFFVLRDTPADAGFENFDTGDASSGEDDEEFKLGRVLKKILTNKVILVIAGIEFCSGVMRNGVMHWFPIYTKELGLPKTFFFVEHWGLVLCIAGITGGMFAGFVSDKVFGSRRGPVAALLYAILVVSTFGMIFVLDLPLILGIVVAIMSMAVIGVHGMLSGTATMDFGGRKSAGTAVGIIDGFVYLGTGVQALALGFITSKDWFYWPIFLLPFTLLGLFMAVKIWYAFPGGAKKSAGH